VLARALLTVMAGVGLLEMGATSWAEVSTVAAVVLLTDGLLGLRVRPGASDLLVPQDTPWMRPIWQVNVPLAAILLLGLQVQPVPLLATVCTVITLLTSAAWLVAALHCNGLVRHALLTWSGVLFLLGTAQRVPLPPASLADGVDRLLGVVLVVLGGLMAWCGSLLTARR